MRRQIGSSSTTSTLRPAGKVSLLVLSAAFTHARLLVEMELLEAVGVKPECVGVAVAIASPKSLQIFECEESELGHVSYFEEVKGKRKVFSEKACLLEAVCHSRI